MNQLKELDSRPNEVIDIDKLPSLSENDMHDILVKKFFGKDITFKKINGKWYVKYSDIEYVLFNEIMEFDEYVNESIALQNSLDPNNFVYEDSIEKDINDPWVNEIGIYEMLLNSDFPEAKKFRLWTAKVLSKLRSSIGLEEYDCLKLLDKDIQNDIDRILDTLYWDEDKKCVMQSVTTPGGDVEQVVFSR
jgi:prophage antirepressor-like protein